MTVISFSHTQELIHCLSLGCYRSVSFFCIHTDTDTSKPLLCRLLRSFAPQSGCGLGCSIFLVFLTALRPVLGKNGMADADVYIGISELNAAGACSQSKGLFCSPPYLRSTISLSLSRFLSTDVSFWSILALLLLRTKSESFNNSGENVAIIL